jgi:hypothetical protein
VKSRQRRLRAIELSLTPQQIVVVWLRDALQAGTWEDGARHSPPYRSAVANAVFRAVTVSMKGQPEELIERAVLQARREADLLYMLVVHANTAVLESAIQREREYVFLLGHLGAEMNGSPTKDTVHILRLTVLIFLKSVIVLDAAIAQLVAGQLTGQPALFSDSEVQLAEQLEMATKLSTWFNKLAAQVCIAEINLERLRDSLQSEIDRQISVWVGLSRAVMLSLFGTTEEVHAAIDQGFLLGERKSDEGLYDAVEP